jgi:general nucleoside transport system permease protein
MEAMALMVSSSVNAGTVLALAALGLLINERAGVINLGAEGMMLIGALAAYATAAHGHGVFMAFAVGAAGAALAAAVFAVGVIWLGTNQYATGLALSLFGSGLTAFVGTEYTGRQIAEVGATGIPGLRDLPLLGWALFHYHPIVYLTAALAVGLGWFFFHSRPGLVVRAAGESPESAHALGHPVRWVRFLSVVAGGALCGMAGAYVSVVYAHLWVEGLIAGKGWIALALTTFATWRPARVLLGAYLFGAVTMVQFRLQGRGVDIESHLLGMLPYLSTILVLVLISRNKAWLRINIPASLGKPFHPRH